MLFSRTITKPHSKGNEKANPITLLTMTGLFAAMITVMTAYILHIPYGANSGYIHFGDALIYLAAALLPQPYALAAAAIGGGLADLFTAPVWAPATVIIKILLTLPFTAKSGKVISRRNIAATIWGALISTAGYYLAEAVIFGNYTAPIASLPGSFIQAAGSAVIFVILGFALDKAHIKRKVNQILYR